MLSFFLLIAYAPLLLHLLSLGSNFATPAGRTSTGIAEKAGGYVLVEYSLRTLWLSKNGDWSPSAHVVIQMLVESQHQSAAARGRRRPTAGRAPVSARRRAAVFRGPITKCPRAYILHRRSVIDRTPFTTFMKRSRPHMSGALASLSG
ncbi:hypothetical protein EVAR_76526_1 [Eumeta japonica]|uniref:Secreted protein n=1 Tax=Eumeta variegata TaxID=151549 RepID=A0A4C1T5N7_EUMVA|nr:hypothetical protein EVAR_76526_1 [Eumeta japonica]